MDTQVEKDFISIHEANLISEMTTDLVKRYVPKNTVRRDLYDAKNKIKNLHIAIPKLMEGLMLSVGFARTVVDALVKRTLLEKIEDKKGPWLETIFKENQGKLLAQKWHKDSGLYGTGYMLIGAGDPAQLEPKTLLTVESPFSTVSKVGRSGELVALLKVVYDKTGQPERGSLYVPGQVINFKYPGNDGYVNPAGHSDSVPYVLTGRFDTGIPFVPAEKIPNNPAGSDMSGSSELTPSIISAIDSVIRTLAQGEYAKEIYSHNQRIILDVDAETAQSIYDNGLPTPVDGAWVFTRTEESGNDLDGKKYAPTPKVQELQAASPAPFLDWIKAYAQLISGETGIPLSRLGYPGSTPQSSEAIKAEEVELVRNANMRKDVFDAFWYRLSVKLFFIEFGRFPEPGEFEYVSHWVQPDVQTPAADMDQAVKLSTINPAQPGADVVLALAGLSPDQIKSMVDAATEAESLKGDMAVVAQHLRQNNPILEKLGQLNYDPEADDSEDEV